MVLPHFPQNPHHRTGNPNSSGQRAPDYADNLGKSHSNNVKLGSSEEKQQPVPQARQGAGRKRVEKRKSQLQQGEHCHHLEGRATGLPSLWLACQGRAQKTPLTSSEDGGLALPLPCLCMPGCPWLNLAAGSGACWAVGVPIEPIHSCRNYLLNARCVHRSLQLVRTG